MTMMHSKRRLGFRMFFRAPEPAPYQLILVLVLRVTRPLHNRVQGIFLKGLHVLDIDGVARHGFDNRIIRQLDPGNIL